MRTYIAIYHTITHLTAERGYISTIHAHIDIVGAADIQTHIYIHACM